MSLRKICVVTGTRAEYGLLFPIMKKIQEHSFLELQLVASTMHLSEDFGLTYQQIEEDGFIIDDKIENLLSSNSKSAIAKSTGLATMLLSESFKRLEPDLVLLLGDRFETHAAATTAMLMNIPIAHIHGGEVTEGAVDEQIRHSITKMSYLHFTSTEAYRQRVIQMGEDDSRVYNTGAPGIDNIIDMTLMEKEELEQGLNWKFGDKSILFTYHPVTLKDEERQLFGDILSALEGSGANILFTYANADDGGRLINQDVESFCKRNPEKYMVVKSLGQLRYLSAMKYVDILVGNTSSGIIEAASFHKPVVNIGDRQKGRLQSGNVIDCDVSSLAERLISAFSIEMQMQCEQVINIYGQGKSSHKIVDRLYDVTLTCVKKFVDKSNQ